MDKMKRAIFIIPYYGSVPVYFENWKYTALRNNDYDFLFITDIDAIREESNIHVLKLSFDELKERMQSKFSFRINLDTPYKLCDYKPAYGYIFSDIIKDYSFWGHCDIDVLLGNLSDFLTDEIFENYDKIFEHGHMTLYRNTEINNCLFMSDGKYPEMNYRRVYESPELYFFDEFYGMMLKSRRLRTKTYYNPAVIIDLDAGKIEFENAINRIGKLFLEWNQGKLFAINVKSGQKEEIVYAHFQKRNLAYMTGLFENDKEPLYIFPQYYSNSADYHSIPKVDYIMFALRKKENHIRDFLKRYRIAKECYWGLFDYYRSRRAIKRRKEKVKEIFQDATYPMGGENDG